MSQPPAIMTPDRLSAFTDAVIAIVITIMVLELPVPEGDRWESLRGSLPLFGAYALSFVNVGIFWVNHHHNRRPLRGLRLNVLQSAFQLRHPL